MAIEWQETALSDILESINTGLDAIRRAPIVNFETGVKCLRIQDISNSKPFLNWGNTEVNQKDYEKYKLVKNDIIMARTCSTGISLLIKEPLNAVFNNGLARIRLKLDRALPEFIAYVFKSKEFVEYIYGISAGTSVQLNMRVGDVAKYKFLLPRLSTQSEIARILRTFDDKIELNRRMNETLEQMAAATFKAWFVDFEPVKAKADGAKSFPSMPQEVFDTLPTEFTDSPLGPIPKGWDAVGFGDIAECYDSKRIPLSKRERSQRQGTYPYYGAASVMDYVDDFLFDGNYVLMGEDGSVITVEGYPVLQYVWGQFWVNNHAHVLQGKNGISTEHLLLSLRQSILTPFITGAVQLKLNQGNMKQIPFVFPTSSVSAAFVRSIDPLFAKYRANVEESRTLTAIRDALLPKLLSGEIRVGETKRIAEEVALQ